MTTIKQEYDLLLKLGFFWEFYPELTGDWVKDQEEFTRKVTALRRWRDKLSKAAKPKQAA